MSNILSIATVRDELEREILNLYPGKIIPVERAGEIMSRFKSTNYAMSQMGMMLYANGYSLRGQSSCHRNGLVFYDDENIFGIGVFSQEGKDTPHLMIIAPHGPSVISAVMQFIETIRKSGLLSSAVFIRHLDRFMYDAFVKAGMTDISEYPWHPTAWREDEQFPNRICILNDLLQKSDTGWNIRHLPYEEAKRYKKKARLTYKRFENFLERNHMHFRLYPYKYLRHQKDTALSIVMRYFESRRKLGGVVGSTPEDYFAIVHQQPYGVFGRDYYAYLGYLESETHSYPISFFAGERLSGNRAALYATLTSRFEEDMKRLNVSDVTGFTALSQYVYLRVMQELKESGIESVDFGGSETEGLDHQKKQLGGLPSQSHWVVCL